MLNVPHRCGKFLAHFERQIKRLIEQLETLNCEFNNYDIRYKVPIYDLLITFLLII